jgi:hypothetical protein
VAPEVRLDPPLLVRFDNQPIVVESRTDAETTEGEEDAAQVVGSGVLDLDVAVRDSRQADEAPDLDVVGADLQARAMQRASPRGREDRRSV